MTEEKRAAELLLRETKQLWEQYPEIWGSFPVEMQLAFAGSALVFVARLTANAEWSAFMDSVDVTQESLGLELLELSLT